MDPPEDQKMAAKSHTKPDPVASQNVAARNDVIVLNDSDDDEILYVGSTQSAVARIPFEAKRMIDLLSSSDEEDKPASCKRQRLRLKSDDHDVVAIVDPVLSSEPPPKAEKKSPPPLPIEQVLDVFPDVELQYARKLLKDNNNVPASVISIIAESGSSYPKEPTKTPAAKGGAKKPPPGTFLKRSTNNPTYDFYSESSFTPTPDYEKASLAQLAEDFPFLTQKGCKTLADAKKHRYAIIHRAVCDAISGKGSASTRRDVDTEISQYNILQEALTGNAVVSNEQKRRLATAFRLTTNNDLNKRHFRANPKRRSTSSKAKLPPPSSDSIFAEEVKFVKHKLEEWMAQVEGHISREEQRKMAVQEGTAVECPCCVNDVAFDEMVQCRTGGHLFCQDCLSMYTENQIFGNGTFGIHPKTKEPALELLCFSGEDCTSGFDREFFIKALSAATLAKYDELQIQIAVNKTDLGKDMCMCPKCHFTACVPETQNVFQCPVEECGFESCRHCGEQSHIPFRCDEVEKEHEGSMRVRVEEAASSAAIRECPKCKKSIMKDGTGGCNKMTCSSCNTKFCYLCRKQVKDYSHFCQVPHCTHETAKCKKCPLYTGGSAKDDDKAAREAALAEASRVREETKRKAQETQQAAAVAPFMPFSQRKQVLKPADGVQIDVESILRAPSNSR